MPQLLPDTLALGPVGLAVRDLDRSLRFYAGDLGLGELQREPGRAVLGAGQQPLLELVERPNGQRDPEEAGLFHVALLTPDRPSLGGILRRLIERQIPLTGAADHTVSEAVYLDDPDGHGLELYADRPRAAWYRDGQFLLGNRPLDGQDLLAQSQHPSGLPATTVVGHVHLESHDLAAARRFYLDRLGLDLMADWPQALFMARGGYHHHLAANVWNQRRRAATDRPDRIGLLYYTFRIDSPASLAALGSAFPEATRRDDTLVLPDSSGLELRVTARR